MNEKVINILKNMTLKEKADITSGLLFWETKPYAHHGIPSVYMSDGPHGIRKENNEAGDLVSLASYPATCFPPAVTVASTWNRDYAAEMGRAISYEAKDQGVCTVLGPGVNIKRSPLCGRNFEYYSEDPYIAGELAYNFINGVQEKGIGTSIKHYAVNSQEYLRMSISSVADMRTLREIYLPAFEKAIKLSQPQTVMCSYNRINGVFSSDNKWLLTDVLREEWGFKGLVMTDWGAMNERVQAIKAGLDLQMPGPDSNNSKKIIKAIKRGELTEAELDKVVERLIDYALEGDKSRDADYKCDYDKSHQISKRIALDGAVLLKNDKSFLPLKKTDKVAVLGELARTPRYQGSGSSRINPYHMVSYLDKLESISAEYKFAAGYKITEDGVDSELLAEAVDIAKTQDKVIIFAGLTDNYETEGADRFMLDIPQGHIDLINAVSEVNPNIVVVLQLGAPITMPWLDKVTAVLNTYLTGDANGEVTYDLLYGDVNPSGKLAETFSNTIEDVLSTKYFRSGPKTVEHREGLYVGYRYFDKAKKDVLFPFGYGLSYTTFEYSDLKLSKKKLKASDKLKVSFTITNTGKVEGAEVAQLYVADLESTTHRPIKELKGFDKVYLKAGEAKEVSIELDSRSFSYYDIELIDWFIEKGEFDILIGKSSQDIVLNDKVTLETSHPEHIPSDDKGICPDYYSLDKLDSISDKSFEGILGHEIPTNALTRKGEYNRNSTLIDMENTWIGKLFMKVGKKILASQIKDADYTTMLMYESIFTENTLRSYSGFSKGIVGDGMVQAIVDFANGKFIKGSLRFWGNIPQVLITFIKVSRQAKKMRKSM